MRQLSQICKHEFIMFSQLHIYRNISHFISVIWNSCYIILIVRDGFFNTNIVNAINVEYILKWKIRTGNTVLRRASFKRLHEERFNCNTVKFMLSATRDFSRYWLY